MEEFYKLIRKKYVPTKHTGLLPPEAEEIANQDARQVLIWYEPSVLGFAFIICEKMIDKSRV